MRITITLDDDVEKFVENYRVMFRPIPTRTKAINDIIRIAMKAKETRERWENEALEAARIKVRTEAVRKLKTKRKRTSKVH